MATFLKTSQVAGSKEVKEVEIDADMTVEQYLTMKCEEMIKDLDNHGIDLIEKLKRDFEEGAAALRDLMKESSEGSRRLCVTLKVIAGPHLGQKFRLESSLTGEDDLFKLGRSTGRHFREKGVSLYKDKEISTTHAKIEMRNGEVFLTDCRSTNGTNLNKKLIEPHIPIRLSEGDIIETGSTEIVVSISDLNDPE